jgi:hypothetical protein
MSKRLNSTQLELYTVSLTMTCISSTNWTKIQASEHVSNSCDLVPVNNTKNVVTDLLDADWLEFMKLGHITVCTSCDRGGREQLQTVLGQYMSKRLNSTKPSS